jgi:hypothetical protein
MTAPRRGRDDRGSRPARSRITQERLDKMAELRRQGITFRAIGERVGCSERTARRYAGHVQPDLHLPDAKPRASADPRTLRETLVTKFMAALYNDKRLRNLSLEWRPAGEDRWVAVYGGPPSVLFLSEAERLLRTQLEQLGIHALRYLAGNLDCQRRFARETIGWLYWDYVTWHQFSQNLGEGTGEDWRPPRWRTGARVRDDEDLDQSGPVRDD